MRDTLVALEDGAVWLAKNPDREPAEPQRVERVAAVQGDAGDTLACSHIRIAQVPDRRAAILCRPVWCWGAGMGVNDAGVAIGNEAIFSRRKNRQPGLLGMVLLRPGLGARTVPKTRSEDLGSAGASRAEPGANR